MLENYTYQLPVACKSSPSSSSSIFSLRLMCLINSTTENLVNTCLLMVLSHSASMPPLRQIVTSFLVVHAYLREVFGNSSLTSSAVRSSYGLAFLFIDGILRTVNLLSCLWWKQLRVRVQQFLWHLMSDCLRLFQMIGMVNIPLHQSDATKSRNAVRICRSMEQLRRNQKTVRNFFQIQRNSYCIQLQFPNISNRFKRQILYGIRNLTLFILI